MPSLKLCSQNAEFINLIFAHKDELELTVTANADNEKPHLDSFYLVSKTSAWLSDRFMLPSSDPKNNLFRLYIFHNKWIDSFFSNKEKGHFIIQAKYSTIKTLQKSYENIQVIDSVNQILNSYVYQITQPLYTSDSSYAIIDASVYFPIESDKNYEDSHEAQMIFIFRRQENRHWILIRKSAIILIQ
jgi:hypothetical protein